MRESVLYIQCGLRLDTQPLAACLLIGKSSIMAVNGTSGERETQFCFPSRFSSLFPPDPAKSFHFDLTGKNLWSALLRNIESQAVLLPDVQGDSVPDLLVATLPADEVQPLPTSCPHINRHSRHQCA